MVKEEVKSKIDDINDNKPIEMSEVASTIGIAADIMQ